MGLSAAVASLAATLTACGTSGSSTATPPPAPVATTPVSCPTPARGKASVWPSELPADLPRPTHATMVGTQKTNDGIFIVRFTTPTSLRDAVLFVVERYPKAGYLLGRGDAESSEADAPFVHGDIRGLTRMSALESCRTLWLVATVKQQTGPLGTSPLLPPHTPTGSPSPLPFG